MTFNKKISAFILHVSRVATWAILLMGIVVRLILFFQDRNLIIDEANIARNLYERNFTGLLLPLSYEQYAPPLFLWVEELFTLMLGYGEKALKIYPLLCGIGSLFVFRAILKKFVPPETIWLPMALMAFSPYLTEFSATVKQYMPDVFIVLMLIWLALETDVRSVRRWKFLIFWGVVGTIAICASMPSVFALAGICMYYTWQCWRGGSRGLLWTPILLGVIWFVLFACYFQLILSSQINSNHLQSYHQDYFLSPNLLSSQGLLHNWYRIRELLNNAIGYGDYNLRGTLLMMLIAIVILLRQHTAALILIGAPLLLTLIAAALHQFSLIMRVSLFLLPLLVILFGIGFGRIYAVRFWPLQILLRFGGIKMIKVFNNFDLFHTYHGYHEITEGLEFVSSNRASGTDLHIHHASVPTYIYYTDIHPEKARYQSLQGATLHSWDTDYTAVAGRISDTAYFLFTGGFPEEERVHVTGQLAHYLDQVQYFEKYVCYVYVYKPRGGAP